MGKKLCTKCNKTRLLKFFYPRSDRPGKYAAWCKVCKQKVWNRWWKKNKRRKTKTTLAWRVHNTERNKQTAKAYRFRLRQEVVEAYGSRCKCCSCKIPQFLAVDHKDGRGHHHRKVFGISGGWVLYAWLKRRGWPKRNFQLLCHNCNMAKSLYGICPHKKGGLNFTHV